MKPISNPKAIGLILISIMMISLVLFNGRHTSLERSNDERASVNTLLHKESELAMQEVNNTSKNESSVPPITKGLLEQIRLSSPTCWAFEKRDENSLPPDVCDLIVEYLNSFDRHSIIYEEIKLSTIEEALNYLTRNQSMALDGVFEGIEASGWYLFVLNKDERRGSSFLTGSAVRKVDGRVKQWDVRQVWSKEPLTTEEVRK